MESHNFYDSSKINLGSRFLAVSASYDLGGGEAMGVAKVVELIGSSKLSFDDAVKNAVDEAAKTIRGIREAWVRYHSFLGD
jgi:hypothetical protein